MAPKSSAPAFSDPAWDRAPSNTKPALPPMADIAARIRAGELLDDLAAEFDRSATTLAGRLSQAGYTTAGYEQLAPTDHDGPSLPVVANRSETWMADANCASTDPELFFPEKGEGNREAKAVCSRCTVAAECLDYALATPERFGVWGGVSAKTRQRINEQSALDNQEAS